MCVFAFNPPIVENADAVNANSLGKLSIHELCLLCPVISVVSYAIVLKLAMNLFG